MARKPHNSKDANTEVKDAEVALAPAENNVNVAESEGDDGNAVGASSACGGQLREAREAQGLTTNDVAKQLRLSNKQIEALEGDLFSQLPEATIVKGFIRNYAKLLKISAQPLLAAYAEMTPDKEHYSFALNPGINMKITEHDKSSRTRYLLLAIALLLGVGVWFFYQNYIQKPSPITPSPEVIETLPELALPMSERLDGAADTVKQLDMPEQSLTESMPEDSNAENMAAGSQGSETTIEAGSNQLSDTVVNEAVDAPEDAVANSAPEPGKTRLKFTATQETWLSVVNVSGEEVYNKILYAGNQDVVDIWQPSQIVVGNAHGASLEVDGKPIDLAPYTRINVARVRLNR